jgi:L-lactate dehydrogenase
LSAEYAALAPGRVFGSGTVLDTARFRFLLAEHFRVDPRSVHGWIIGEHGDHSVPVWSATSIGGMPVSKLAGPNGEPPSTETLNHIYVSMRDAAQAIIKRKSATYYAIGLSLLRIVEAVLKNQRAVLSVTHPLAGAHGASGMSLSLPCVVGRDGVESTIELPLDGPEHAAFLAAGAALRARLAELD